MYVFEQEKINSFNISNSYWKSTKILKNKQINLNSSVKKKYNNIKKRLWIINLKIHWTTLNKFSFCFKSLEANFWVLLI
jgi:hypothetical protein